MDTYRTKRVSRRTFLFAMSAGGAATVAAIAAGTSGPRSAVKGNGERARRGYHTTEHVNNYYRTAKV
jgi:hypothetical protein